MMSSLSPSSAQIQICLSAAESTGHANGHQIDRDVCSNIIQHLASKITEILGDPSVLHEIAQHERNTRIQALRSTLLNNGINSSEMNERLLRFLTYNDPELEASTQSQQHVFDENTDENEDQEDFLSCTSTVISRNDLSMFENYSNENIRRRIAYPLIIAAVILLVTILASGLTLFVIWMAMNSGSIIVFDSMVNALKITNEVNQISVGSSDEYNLAISNSNTSRLAINIELERPGDWPTGTLIQMTTNVHRIRIHGKFHVKKLTSLLGSVTSLEVLELVNRDNLICTESTEPIRLFDKSSKVSISIKHLSLEYFKSSTCIEALRLLYENVELSGLESILIKDGKVNIQNVASHENLLYKYRKSLKKLEISNTLFETAIFVSQPAFRFDNVRTLVLEESFENNKTIFSNPIAKICSVFPNVEKLSFGMTMKHFGELVDLLGCVKLKSVQIRIWVPYSNKNFSLSFLARKFSKLESADFTLSFGSSFPVGDEECRESYMHVDGKNDLPKLLLANIRLASNCRLKFDD